MTRAGRPHRPVACRRARPALVDRAAPIALSAALVLGTAGAASHHPAAGASPSPIPAATSVAGVVGEALRARTAVRRSEAALAASRAGTGSALDRSTAALLDHRVRTAVHPPVLGARVTSEFGPRWGRQHRGIDFGADLGEPLYAVARGMVTTSDHSPGLGHHVRLRLGDGTEVTYAHLSRTSVDEGAHVLAGDVVGEVGDSGRSTGPHLHLEVHEAGKPVDPGPWLVARGLLDRSRG